MYDWVGDAPCAVRVPQVSGAQTGSRSVLPNVVCCPEGGSRLQWSLLTVRRARRH